MAVFAAPFAERGRAFDSASSASSGVRSRAPRRLVVIDWRSGAGMGEVRCRSLNLRICRTLSAVQRPWSAIGRQLRSPRDVARETRSRPSRPLFSFRGWVCGRRLALTWTGEGSGGVGRLGLCLLPGGAVGGGWSLVVEDVCRVIRGSRALSLPVLSAPEITL